MAVGGDEATFEPGTEQTTEIKSNSVQHGPPLTLVTLDNPICIPNIHHGYHIKVLIRDGGRGLRGD